MTDRGRQCSAARASGAWMQRRVAVAAVLALVASAVMAPAIPALAADNPIVIENQLAGSTAWRLPPGLFARGANWQIKGDASATSVKQKESITVHVSVDPGRTSAVYSF